MLYSYCVNTFTKYPDGSTMPTQKSGTINIPANLHKEKEVIDYLISIGIINECGYEILELEAVNNV